MEYFILQQDERIYNTIYVPVFSILDHRDYKNYDLEKLSPMTVITRKGSVHEEYPDLLSGLFLVSERLGEVISAFAPGMKYRTFCFWDQQKDAPFYYYAYMPPAVEGLSEKSIVENRGTVIVKAVIRREEMKDFDIVRISGWEKHLIVVSLPVAEAILRRNLKGIRLIQTYLDQGRDEK